MAQVELKNLSKKYGKVTAVQNMDLIIPHNQSILVLLRIIRMGIF